MPNIFSNLGCLNLSHVGCQEKKAPITRVHTQNSLAYFFDFHRFLGGGQSPFRYQVSCAWQLGRQCQVEEALHSTSPDATCSQPSHRPPSPAATRNGLSLAHSPDREGARMEPGNLETCKAGTLRHDLSIHHYATNAPLSNKSLSLHFPGDCLLC